MLPPSEAVSSTEAGLLPLLTGAEDLYQNGERPKRYAYAEQSSLYNRVNHATSSKWVC